MLNEKRIEELTELMKQGNEAEILLKENKELIERKHAMEESKKMVSNSCKSIRIEIAYNSFLEFKVNMQDFAISRMIEILDNEIRIIDTKLKHLN